MNKKVFEQDKETINNYPDLNIHDNEVARANSKPMLGYKDIMLLLGCEKTKAFDEFNKIKAKYGSCRTCPSKIYKTSFDKYYGNKK